MLDSHICGDVRVSFYDAGMIFRLLEESYLFILPFFI